MWLGSHLQAGTTEHESCSEAGAAASTAHYQLAASEDPTLLLLLDALDSSDIDTSKPERQPDKRALLFLRSDLAL